jgi:hypothetical protein
MGAGSSTGAGRNTDANAAAAANLANTLLTKILTQTDMLAYLTMTDPKACANFDFSSVSPTVQKTIQDTGVKILGQGQNVAVCFEQAKGYSKCFEIYAALYPILADSAIKRSNILLQGGRRTRKQRGGKFEPTRVGNDFKASILYGFGLFTAIDIIEKGNTEYFFKINISEGKLNRIECIIPKKDIKSQEINIVGKVYISNVPKSECNIQIKSAGKTDNDLTKIILSIETEPVLFIFTNENSTSWFYSDKEDATTETLTPLTVRGTHVLPEETKKLIRKLAFEEGDKKVTAASGSASGSAFTSAQSISGAFFPTSVGNIKKNLKNMKDVKKNKPIALAVARALILMRPLDPADNTGRPPTTQICSSKYTFEGKDSHVPRKGIALEKTYYFKSWMNLYNDTGIMRQGKYEWTKSAEGLQELEQAAKDLSILYSPPNSQAPPDPKFLSTSVKEFITACPNRYDGEYTIPPQVQPQIKRIVDELLKVQKTYVGYANAILSEVFDFKADGTVMFRNDILGVKGYAKLSELCKKTRHMLFQYYMSVESLFIQGVIVYEQALALGLLRPM